MWENRRREHLQYTMGQKYMYRPILILIIIGMGAFALEDHGKFLVT